MRTVPAHRRPARRPARRLLPAVGVGAALLLGACGAGGAPGKDTVQDRIEDRLTEVGYLATADAEPVTLTEGQATDAARCIADTLFDGETFTKDEREDVVRAVDGSRPDEELGARTQALVSDCVSAVLAAGPTAPADDD